MMSLLKNYFKRYVTSGCLFVLISVIACKEQRKAEIEVKKTDTTDHFNHAADSMVISKKMQQLAPGQNTHDSSLQMIISRVRNTLLTEVFKNDLAALKYEDRRFTIQQIDINGDHRKEIFVGFSGRYHCVNGGCRTLLLNHAGKLITRFVAAEYPIIVRPTSTKGWRDLVIGTAVEKPSLHLVKSNGKSYPENPSKQPEFELVPSEKSERVFNFEHYDEQWFTF